MLKTKHFLILLFSCTNIMSCGKLTFDNSVAYPLLMVSEAKTPASEEIRYFVRQDDLIYTASGSGGILVYRIIGDTIEPVRSLSLTNLYSANLEQIFVRTVEILKTEFATNLIFSFDTVQGGGIGIAEISDSYTKPLGSLAVEQNFRIRNTITTFNPEGKYQILLADENQGLLTYEMSFLSNDFFEYPKITGLVDLISSMEATLLPDLFQALESPSAARVTNISQLTNFDSLISLAINDENTFNELITNIPFLSPENQRQLQQLVKITDKSTLSNVLNLSKTYFSSNTIQNILTDPMVAKFLSEQNNNAFSGIISNIQPLQSFVNSDNNYNNLVNKSNPVRTLRTFEETETLYAESYLSNLKILQGEEIPTDDFHDLNYFPLTNRRSIGNARQEIEKTIQSVGRKFFSDDEDTIKNALYQFSPEELELFFQSALQQAHLLIELIPQFNNAGVNLQQVFKLFQEKQYYKIIEILDNKLIAEILRLLPKFQIKTDFNIIKTNAVIKNIRHMVADQYFLYVASGPDGFYIIDRITDDVIDFHKKPFSEVSMVIPYEIYNKRYYVVVDNLDGLVLYHRTKNNKIGTQVSRVALVGEAFSVFPYENILWVADGINGVLGVRVNKDQTLTIESESYQKGNIAYFIGGGLRREVLASYGADGLKVLRLTNVLSSAEFIRQTDESVMTQPQEPKKNFVDKTLEWSKYSPIARFLKSLFFDI
ncbi:MAG: hypothetical protein ACRCTJ_06275 [Brevinema sp.]